MRTLFVTGGTGYLGSEVVAQAQAAGLRVVAPSHASLDVRDADAVLAATTGADAIIHTAYRQNGDDAWSIIVDGTANVARAAKAHGARLVHLSTDLVFDGKASRPYREDDEPNPIIRYGEAKLESERVAREIADALVVRTSLLFGKPTPGQHERDFDLTFFTDEIRCPTNVIDLAAALLELASRDDVRGILHVAGPEAMSRYEFARRIAESRGRDPSTLKSASSAGTGRPQNCALDTTRAQSLLRTRVRALRADPR